MRFFLLLLMISATTSACAGTVATETAVDTNAGELPQLSQPVPVEPSAAAQRPAPVVSTTVPAAADLPVLDRAPAWDNEVWINSDTALPLDSLRGKVVLLEFWTFG